MVEASGVGVGFSRKWKFVKSLEAIFAKNMFLDVFPYKIIRKWIVIQ